MRPIFHHMTALALTCATLFAMSPALADDSKAWPDVPVPITSFGAAMAGDWLYVYSGHTGRPHRYSKDDYDMAFRRINLAKGAAGEWESLPFGPPRQGLAFVEHNGMLVRIGGLVAHNAKGEPPKLISNADVERFDPKTKQWSTLTPMPEPRSSHEAVVMGNHLYVVGGWHMTGDDEHWHRTALVADLTKQPIKWKKIEQPFRRRAVAAAELDGKVLVIGGFTPASKVSARTNVYDPQTGKWTRHHDVPTEYQFKMFGSAAFRLRDQVYANGGDGIIYVLSKPDAPWTKLETKLDHPRFFHRMVPWGDDRLVFIAGAGKAGFLKSIEVVDIPQASQ